MHLIVEIDFEGHFVVFDDSECKEMCLLRADGAAMETAAGAAEGISWLWCFLYALLCSYADERCLTWISRHV